MDRPHFPAVFTIPAELRPLFRTDRDALYDLLLRCAARTLEAIARKKLGVTVATTALLHTWNQSLLFHPRVHCIVTGGGLTKDGAPWSPRWPRSRPLNRPTRLRRRSRTGRAPCARWASRVPGRAPGRSESWDGAVDR